MTRPSIPFSLLISIVSPQVRALQGDLDSLQPTMTEYEQAVDALSDALTTSPADLREQREEGERLSGLSSRQSRAQRALKSRTERLYAKQGPLAGFHAACDDLAQQIQLLREELKA